MRQGSVSSVPTPPRPQPLRRVAWRVLQFCQCVSARDDPAVDAQLRHLLDNDAQWQLLRRLSPFDRRHHLRVYTLLRERGCDDEDVLRAALLHDAGKADGWGRAHVGHRTLKVLLGLLGPRWLDLFASESARGPRHGLYLASHHARLGSQLARPAGASERCCELIARHDCRRHQHDPGLSALIAADNGAIR